MNSGGREKSRERGKKGGGRGKRSGEQLSGSIHLTRITEKEIPLDRQGVSRQRTKARRETEGTRV